MASFDIVQNIRVKKNTVYCARKPNSTSLKSKGLFFPPQQSGSHCRMNLMCALSVLISRAALLCSVIFCLEVVQSWGACVRSISHLST